MKPKLLKEFSGKKDKCLKCKKIKRIRYMAFYHGKRYCRLCNPNPIIYYKRGEK